MAVNRQLVLPIDDDKSARDSSVTCRMTRSCRDSTATVRAPRRAIAVMVWRDEHGTRIVRAETTRVPAIAVRAVLVALDASVNIDAWLDDDSGD